MSRVRGQERHAFQDLCQACQPRIRRKTLRHPPVTLVPGPGQGTERAGTGGQLTGLRDQVEDESHGVLRDRRLVEIEQAVEVVERVVLDQQLAGRLGLSRNQADSAGPVGEDVPGEHDVFQCVEENQLISHAASRPNQSALLHTQPAHLLPLLTGKLLSQDDSHGALADREIAEHEGCLGGPLCSGVGVQERQGRRLHRTFVGHSLRMDVLDPRAGTRPHQLDAELRLPDTHPESPHRHVGGIANREHGLGERHLKHGFPFRDQLQTAPLCRTIDGNRLRVSRLVQNADLAPRAGPLEGLTDRAIVGLAGRRHRDALQRRQDRWQVGLGLRVRAARAREEPPQPGGGRVGGPVATHRLPRGGRPTTASSQRPRRRRLGFLLGMGVQQRREFVGRSLVQYDEVAIEHVCHFGGGLKSLLGVLLQQTRHDFAVQRRRALPDFFQRRWVVFNYQAGRVEGCLGRETASARRASRT